MQETPKFPERLFYRDTASGSMRHRVTKSEIKAADAIRQQYLRPIFS
jgi:hypothetical protein